MRTFGNDSPQFFAFKLEGSDDVYEIPLAASLPMSVLIEIDDADAKVQLGFLRRYMGDKADELTVEQFRDIFAAWVEESAKQGATLGE